MTRKPSPDETSPRRGPGAPEAGSAEKEAEWGFAQTKNERTLEPRLGIALVTCLVLMFGFVLYSKYRSLERTSGDNLAGHATTGKDGQGSPPAVSGDLGLSAETPAGMAGSGPRNPREPSPLAEESPSALARSEPAPTLEQSDIASSAAGSRSTSSDPFVVGTFEGSSRSNEAPPRQSEPNPFGDPSAQDGDSSAQTANSEPYFAADSSTVAASPPSGPAIWDFGGDPQPAGTAEPDPFAASEPVPPREDAAASWDFAVSEPQTLPSPENATPLPAPPSEPDLFAGAEATESVPEDVESGGDWEPNPVGGERSAASFSWEPPQRSEEWSLTDAPDAGGEARAPSLPVLQAPEVHAEPGPSSPGHSAVTARDWDLAPPASSSKGGLGEPVVTDRQLTVTRRDTLWSISQQVYGTARYVPALARYNQQIVPHPEKLPLGVHLLIPPPEVLEAQYPELFRKMTRRDGQVSPAGGSIEAAPSSQAGLFLNSSGAPLYRVGKSDTLSRIAQRSLGRASRWTEIFEMNRDRLPGPESLKPGMVLRLPPDAARVAVDSQPLLSR